MEIAKTCDTRGLNNDTERPMTLSDFERKYLDPRIRQEYEELEEEVDQDIANIERATRKIRKDIELLTRLYNELDDE